MLITFLITFTRGRIHFLSKESRQWFDAISAEYCSSGGAGWWSGRQEKGCDPRPSPSGRQNCKTGTATRLNNILVFPLLH